MAKDKNMKHPKQEKQEGGYDTYFPIFFIAVTIFNPKNLNQPGRPRICKHGDSYTVSSILNKV
jgi:hypothetical protein